MSLEERYNKNRPDEVNGLHPLSPEFFQTWRDRGLIPAFHSVCDFVRKNGHNNATLKALGIIFGSSILTTGLTQYVNNLRATVTDNNFSILQQAGLIVYAGSVGMIMAGHTDAREEVEVHTEGQRKITTTTTKGRWGATHEHTEIEVDEPRSYFDQD